MSSGAVEVAILGASLSGEAQRRAPRIFLCNATRLVTETLARALRNRSEVELVDAESEPRKARRRVASLEPDVILVEASHRRRAALRLTRQLRDAFPDPELLAIGVDDDDEIIRFAEAGARAYVRSEASISDLVRVVLSLYRKETRCSPRVAASLYSRLRELSRRLPQPSPGGAPRLTPRETQVLRLLSSGLQNKEIARRLSVRLPTVKNHVHQILSKFEVKTRREATVYAAQAGFIDRGRRPRSARRR